MGKHFFLVVFALAGASPALAAVPAYNFEGIVRLPVCSGSFVRFTSSRDTDPGLMLTNGHCSGEIPPAGFVYHRNLRPHPQAINLLKPDGTSAGWVIAPLLLYATRTDTDIALYQMDKTYAEIESSFGVHPLLLSPEHPALGSSVEVISGYWGRGYSCSIEAFVPELKEGPWIQHDSLRYSRPGCDVLGGTSGSPVLAGGTRVVVGINNTKNEAGQACTDRNPCEIDEQGHLHYAQDYAYAQETYTLYSCLNAKAEFDLSVPGCLLPK
ncbi:MAG: trypsin-like serine peptidase [Bdellovibrionota bacterium]